MHEADLSLSKYTTAQQLDDEGLTADGCAYGQPKRRRRRWRDAASTYLRGEEGWLLSGQVGGLALDCRKA